MAVTRVTLADVSLAKLLDVVMGSTLVDVMHIGYEAGEALRIPDPDLQAASTLTSRSGVDCPGLHPAVGRSYRPTAGIRVGLVAFACVSLHASKCFVHAPWT